MIPLKSDYSFAWLDNNGMATQNNEVIGGIYHHDIRHFSQYIWHFNDGFELIWTERDLNILQQVWIINGHHEPKATIKRQLCFHADGFTDELTIVNERDEPQHFDISLQTQTDFSDLFALRSEFYRTKIKMDVINIDNGFSAILEDKSQVQSQLHYSLKPENDQNWHFELLPKSSQKLTITARFTNDQRKLFKAEITKEEWAQIFSSHTPNDHANALVYQRNVDDLYHLLLSTEYGFYPAAGVPIFVTPFGRDGLLTANMLVKTVPALSRSVLAFAASIQGKINDSFREEEPGKIFHEIRLGPLAQLNKVPFSRYYGTADATALWVKLFGDYIKESNDINFLKAHKEHLQRAITWLNDKIKDNIFIQFSPEGRGLSNQNWKDSPNSNCHKDGKQAEAPIANIEVQGYAYAAFKAAHYLFEQLGQDDDAQKMAQQAQKMYDNIQKYFWIEELGFYAMGLDAHRQPLEVISSNVGHLLWCDAVPKERAQKVVDILLSDQMWSGWGLRTLSKKEVAYAPLGYHIGSVWPHDTALFALGAAQYNIFKPMQLSLNALSQMSQYDAALSLPEVTGGFDKVLGQKPIPCIRSCIPQAWAAAGLIALQIGMSQNKT